MIHYFKGTKKSLHRFVAEHKANIKLEEMKTFWALSSELHDSKEWLISYCTVMIFNSELPRRTSFISFIFVSKSEPNCKIDLLKNRLLSTWKEMYQFPQLSNTKNTVLFDSKAGLVTFTLILQQALQNFSEERWKDRNFFVAVICSEAVSRKRIIYETINNILNSPGDERTLQFLCRSMLKLQLSPESSLLSPLGLGRSITRKGFPKEEKGKVSIADSIHLMFVVLGWTGDKPAESIEVFDGNTKKWSFFLHETPFARAYHGVSLLGSYLYIIGGFNGYTCVTNTLCLNIRTREWTRKCPMLLPRCYLFTLVFKGEIYAIGGHNGERRLKTCEIFDPKRDKWDRACDMLYRRSDASGAVLGDKIIVCGGFDGFRFHASTEIYDPITDQWSLVGNLLNPRSGHCMVTFDNHVFALGGFNGQVRLRQVEKFNEESNQWEDSVPMLDGRSNFCCTVFQEEIYVIGGYDGRTTMPNTEKFDKTRMEWQRAPSLNVHRSAAGACVMDNTGSVSSCKLKELIPMVSRNAEESSP